MNFILIVLTYYIGHFSIFIKPGAKRIGLDTSIEGLSSTAFRNENGGIVLVVLNETEEVKSITIQIEDNYVEIEVDRRAIATLVI